MKDLPHSISVDRQAGKVFVFQHDFFLLRTREIKNFKGEADAVEDAKQWCKIMFGEENPDVVYPVIRRMTFSTTKTKPLTPNKESEG